MSPFVLDELFDLVFGLLSLLQEHLWSALLFWNGVLIFYTVGLDEGLWRTG